MKHELKVLESGSWELQVTEQDGRIKEEMQDRRTEMIVEVECSCGAEFNEYNEKAIKHLENPEQTYCEKHDETFLPSETCKRCRQE